MPTYTYDPVSDPSADSGGTYAYGINGSNQVVGGDFLNHVEYGFLDTNGVFSTLTDPKATGGVTAASGINNSGQVVGTFVGADGYHGFLYSGCSYTTLNDPSAANPSDCLGINDSIEVVGDYYSGCYHGFLFSGGNWMTRDDPVALSVGGQTYAYGINNSSVVVGYFTDSSNHSHGFLESAGHWTTLDDPAAGPNGATFASG